MEKFNGYFGQFGAYVPNSLKEVLKELENDFYNCMEDEEFQAEWATI